MYSLHDILPKGKSYLFYLMRKISKDTIFKFFLSITSIPFQLMQAYIWVLHKTFDRNGNLRIATCPWSLQWCTLLSMCLCSFQVNKFKLFRDTVCFFKKAKSFCSFYQLKIILQRSKISQNLCLVISFYN